MLINNAAIGSGTYQTTVDGQELGLQTNHLGPFLFTALVYPKLSEEGETRRRRIVNISSEMHASTPFLFEGSTFDDGKSYDLWAAYASTKSANLLFIHEIVRRSEGKVFSFSVHPGCEFFSLLLAFVFGFLEDFLLKKTLLRIDYCTDCSVSCFLFLFSFFLFFAGEKLFRLVWRTVSH